MAINTAKRKEKTDQLMATLKGGGEPTVTQEDYNLSLTNAFNWYNINENEKNLRKWLITYLVSSKQKEKVVPINLAADYELRQISVLARLKMRDQYLSDEHEFLFNTRIKELVAKYTELRQEKKEAVAASPVISIQERMEELARKHAAEFDAACDEFTLLKKSDFSAKNYLLSNNVSAPIAKRIGELFKPLHEELLEAYADKDQLSEGYSNFTKPQLKKFAAFVASLISDCQQQVVSAKVNRAPRKKKPVPPAKLVSRMKYMKEFDELKLKSVVPTSIIGSDEVWFYNTKYRKIGVYKGDSGGTLSVKGTTILGFDIKQSQSWTLRKPEEFFKGLSLGKRALNTAVKAIKTKPTTPNGRINEDTILLGAF